MITDDEWSHHQMNGEAFAGIGFQTGVGGQIAHVQIFNPAGSGVRIRMRCLQPLPVFGIAINSNIRRHDVPLATLAPFAGPNNLLGGGPAAVAEIRNVSQVGILGSPFWLILSAGSTRKNYPVKSLDWGHDLLEDQGILLQSVSGGFILLAFMWVEVPL